MRQPRTAAILGVIRRGQALPEFEEVIFTMREGDISEVIRTPNGLHIVKIEAFSKGSEQTFPESKLRSAPPAPGENGAAFQTGQTS